MSSLGDFCAWSFLGILAFVLVSCSPGDNKASRSNVNPSLLKGNAQGTQFTIRYFDSQDRDFSEGIQNILTVVDNNFSWYRDSSIISDYNRADSGDTIPVNEEFFRMLQLSYSMTNSTNGGFNAAVKPLVDYWGFGQGESGFVGEMDSTVVDSIHSLCQLDSLFLITKKGELSVKQWSALSDIPDTLLLRKSSALAQLDFNAIAQGYAVDVLSVYLNAKGVTSYMVELGGELRVGREKPNGDMWVIQVDQPTEGMEHNSGGTLSFMQRAAATSGNYRKYHEINGQKIVHTMNPRSGYPVVNSLLSATVLASTAAEADALATAMMVNGWDWAKQFTKGNDNIDAVLIGSNEDGSTKRWISPGIQKQFKEKVD